MLIAIITRCAPAGMTSPHAAHVIRGRMEGHAQPTPALTFIMLDSLPGSTSALYTTLRPLVLGPSSPAASAALAALSLDAGLALAAGLDCMVQKAEDPTNAITCTHSSRRTLT